jgi:GMP synthase-like glutamine amidotransferase
VAPKVLFLYNDHTSTEALLGEAFTEKGYDVEVFEVVPADRSEHPAGEVTFPDPRGYDAIVPMGARWAVYDETLRDTWVGTEMAMMRDAAEAGVPLLGVCFGGQLLAQAFGGTVERSPDPEIGWYDFDSDDPGLLPGGPWFEWHFDRFTVPPGAVEIARTPGAPQAFVLGRTLGLQFHPELDRPLLERWLTGDSANEVAGLGRTLDGLRSQTDELVDDAARRIRALVHGFLTRVARQPCPS